MSPGSPTVPFITLKCFSSVNIANELYKYMPDNNKALKIIAVNIIFLLLFFSLNFCSFRELCLFNNPPPQQIFASFFLSLPFFFNSTKFTLSLQVLYQKFHITKKAMFITHDLLTSIFNIKISPYIINIHIAWYSFSLF